ncbi:MAG: type II secretion system protein [bacterium]|nr:type II secretion system protein [bacterium]
MSKKSVRSGVRGFTLIELLVVISLIGLLSSIIYASLSKAREKSGDAKAVTDLNTLNTAVQLYYSDYGKWPPGSSAISYYSTLSGLGIPWSTLMTVLRPYLPKDVVPPFPSLPSQYGAISQGYTFVSTNGTPTTIKFWNGNTGVFSGCIILTEGYHLDFLLPNQSALTLNDHGIDPDGFERADGNYVYKYTIAECP